jgi:Leucine-rich repeat (LRR) protein
MEKWWEKSVDNPERSGESAIGRPARQENPMHDAASSPVKRPWYRVRFSVRAIIILVAVLGCWLGWTVHRARVQRDAVNALTRDDGRGTVVWYDWEYNDGRHIRKAKPPGPRWLVERVGVDYFGSVVRVFLSQHGSDADLIQIGNLDRLKELIFTQSSPTDTGLIQLEGLTRLTYLDLSKSGVSDVGIAHLKRLTGLQWLILKDCPISDAGLAEIRGLTHLVLLGLNGTRITDEGLVHLEGFSGIQHLYFTHAEIGDAGLEYLKGLSALQTLYLNDTKVTDAGLAHLKGLTRLTILNLAGTRVTDAGVQDLQRALPKAKIIR